MRKLVSLLVASSAVVGLASGCAMEAPVGEQESAGADHLALLSCANPEGTNAMIAGLAVAIANDLGRWNVTTDFKEIMGRYNQKHLALSDAGLARCGVMGNACENIKALLFFQDALYDNYIRFPGNVRLSSWSYASRLVAGFGAQKTCEARAVQNPNSQDACPAEPHQLTLLSTSPGGCDMNFTYRAAKPNGASLDKPYQLKNKLLWANDGGSKDRPNPYVQFQSTADTVTIDPSWDLNVPGSSSGGSCTLSCQKYSPTPPTGCCTCNGASGTWQPSPTANIYKCSAGG